MDKNIMQNSTIATRQEKARLMWSVIEKYISLRQMRIEDIAVKMHCGPQLLRNRRAEPDKLTFGELIKLVEVLKIPPVEIAEVIPGRRILLMEGDRLLMG